MEKVDEGWMTLDDALAQIMRVTGKTRRQAHYELLKHFRAGTISTCGENIKTGEREPIPKDYWPSVN